MGKGAMRAQFDISVVLDTFGGMGSVTGKVKITEGKKIVAESEFPITKFEGSNEHVPAHIVGRWDAEETFKEVAGELEKCLRRFS